MKKFLCLFVASISLLCLFVSSVSAGTVDNVIAIDDRLGKAAEPFIDASQTADTAEAALLVYDKYASTLLSAVSEAADSYKSEANKTKDQGLKNEVTKLAAATELLQTNLKAYIAAVTPEAKQDAAIDFETNLGAYEKAVNDINSYITKNPEKTGDTTAIGYLALLVGSIVLALGALIFAFKNDQLKLNWQQERQMKLQIFYATLAIVLGAAITYGGYRYALSKQQESYTIFYGLVLIGAAYFIQRVVVYVKWRKEASPLPK